MKKNVTYHLFAIDGINSTKIFFTTEFLTVLRVFSQNVILSFYEKIKNGKLTSVSAMCMLLSICTFAQTPTITNFTPKTGKPGDIVTLTGANFNTTAANNIVFFGATRAQVNTATATSVTVRVPFGATCKPITLINSTTSLGAYSRGNFVPIYSVPKTEMSSADFLPKVNFTAGSSSVPVSIGDMDGDGKSDLVSANPNGNSISVFRNTSSNGIIGTNSFDNKQDFTTGTDSQPNSLEIADLDMDGKLDLIVSYSTNSTLSVFRNTSTVGSLSFGPIANFTVGSGSKSIAVGDLNMDGKTDIAVANLGSNNISVLRNTSVVGTLNSSSFVIANNIPTGAGTQPNSIAIGNIDTDGKPDMVVSDFDKNKVYAFRNMSSTSNTSFALLNTFNTGTNPSTVVLFDADSDGKLDLAVANSHLSNSSSFSIFRNTSGLGSFNFLSKVDFGTSRSRWISVGDLDGDGKLDVVTENAVFNKFVSGNIVPTSYSSLPCTSENIVSIGDLDGDTKPDLVLMGTVPTSSVVSVIRNKDIAPPVLFPGSDGKPGTSINLGMINCSNLPTDYIVYFGATKSLVNQNQCPNGLTVNIPIGATYAPISVLNTRTGLAGYATTNFMPTFDLPQKNDITVSDFLPPVDFATGTNSDPQSIALGDFDGDGKADMVVANKGVAGSTGTVSVFRNISVSGSINSTSFAPKVDFPVGTNTNNNPGVIAVGDIDRDGKLDIMVVKTGGAGYVSFLRNTSTIGVINTSSFATHQVIQTGPYPQAIALSDFDSDGRLDMAITNGGNVNKVSLFRNTFIVGTTGSSLFASKVEFATGLNPQAIAIGDFNYDLKPDMVVANGGVGGAGSSGGISVFKNTSTTGLFNFANRVDIATGTNPVSIAVGDVDRDNYPDILVANADLYGGSQYVSFFKNIPSTPSAITLAPKLDIITPLMPKSIALADMDGNRSLDMVVANSSNSLSVFKNITVPGSSSVIFASPVRFGGNFNMTSSSLAIGDLDGDLMPDIVASFSGLNSVSVLRNSDAPPVITSFSPISGKPGDLITLTGYNFNLSATNNIVYFGATKAVVTSASATSVTVIVPVGATYDKISLYNKKALGLTGYSKSNFTPTYNPPTISISADHFLPKVDFITGLSPQSISIGDLDGDGKSDMVVANNGASSITIFQNTSNSGSINISSFASGVPFTVGSSPTSVALGDLDRDGKLDIVVVNSGSNSVSFLRNISTNGTINTSSFENNIIPNIGTSPQSVALHDLDADGRLDMVVVSGTTASNSFVSVFRNVYNPTIANSSFFTNGVNFSTGLAPKSVAIGDINGDGKPEIAVANSGSNSVTVYRNNCAVGFIGTASFVILTPNLVTGTNPQSIAMGDLDGDGRLDLAVANFSTNNISVLRNTTTTGVISFEFKQDFPTGTGSNPKFIAIGDIDGNGKPDLAIANSGSNTVSILQNTTSLNILGTISFASSVQFPGGIMPRGLAVGDLDGDDIPDVAVLNGSNFVSILRRMDLPPVITSFSPLTGKPGDVITLTGENFNALYSNNTVFFGATKAQVIIGTSTSVTVKVPVGASFAPISLLNSKNGLIGLSRLNFTPSYKPAKNDIVRGDYSYPGQVISGLEMGLGGFPVLCFGDLDLDGKPELIHAGTIGFNGTKITISQNNSVNGAFNVNSFLNVSIPVPVNSGAIYAMSIGDLDGDGKPDLAAVTSAGFVLVFRNISTSGNFVFEPAKVFTCGLSAYSLKIIDIDGDGKLDMAVTSQSDNTITIFQNTSTKGVINSSSFVNKVVFSTGQSSMLAVGDIDGDHKPELIFSGNKEISIMQNTSVRGSINLNSFSGKVNFSTGLFRSPMWLDLADFDADGKTDIVALCSGADFIVSVFRNTSTTGSINSGSLATKVDLETGALLGLIAVSDIDGDDKPDLGVVNRGSDNITIYKNTTVLGSQNPISFASKIEFTCGDNPFSLIMGDLDGDGRPDLVTAYTSGNAEIFRNADLPPTITDFNPKTGKPGDIITLTGTNFNTTASNNIVYFGATKATVVSATATSATVIVPIGATFAAISLANTGIGLSANSKVKFTPTYTPSKSGISPDDFYSNVDFSTGGTSYSTAIADLDGDGKSDLAVTDFNSNTVSIFQNTSNVSLIDLSSFAAKVDFTTGSEPVAVAIGDLDGDGKPDLVVANSLSNTISIFRNIATNGMINISSFATSIDFPVGTTPYSVAIEDFDGDGKLDIAVVNKGGNTVSVLRNISVNSINFATKVDFTTGNSPSSLVAADLDGDGKVDLAITNESDNSVSILRNISSRGSISLGCFEPKVDFIVGSAPRSIAVGDLDGDNKADLVIANLGTNSFSVLYNMSYSGSIHTQSFAPSVDFMTSSVSSSVTIGDLTGDGKPEIALANNNINTVSVFQNSSNPGLIDLSSFTNANDFTTGNSPFSVAMGDLDGDELTDLVLGGVGVVSVLRNSEKTLFLIPSNNNVQNSVTNNLSNDVLLRNNNAVVQKTSEVLNTDMIVYPNPASKLLNVNLTDGELKNSTMTIINVSGKEVFRGILETAQSQVNIENLPMGVYLVKVTNETGFNKTIKFVKQ